MSTFKFFQIFFVMFVTLSVITNSYSLSQRYYSIKDLEALEAQANYQEFLEHAKDILPGNRDKHWREMVFNMASGLIQSKLKRKVFDENSYKFIEALMLWPTLQNDEFFQIKRGEYGYQYLKNCLKNQGLVKKIDLKKDRCVKKLHVFWNNSLKNTADFELAIKLAKLLNRYHKTADLWPFIKKITKSSISEFYCKKAVIRKGIIQKLTTIYTENFKEKKLNNKVSAIISLDCWKQIASDIKVLLFTSNVALSEYYYSLLKHFNSLSEPEEDLFLIKFILDGPVVGDTFNLAWSRATLLGQNFKRRNKLLAKLKRMDPLPDKLFSSIDVKKKKILINHLYENIPEYLDFYSKTCLEYYKGTKKFINGNPTIYCHQFFKTSKKSKWINKALYSKYQKIFPD